jgi:hypothetical protein
MLNIEKAIVLSILMAILAPGQLKAQSGQEIWTSVISDDWDANRSTSREPGFDGKPLSYWIKAVRDRDEARMSLALEAIRLLGPEARTAVPELTRLLADPFRPIQLGKDSDATIAAKLYDIEVRSAAIDALASIGDDAATATLPVIQWALTMRVIPGAGGSMDRERFIALVTLEAEYRIRVINAIEQFGEPAIPTLRRLLKSPDPERRKFAVIALGTDILPIAEELLQSRDCAEAQLGVTILRDLAPIVASAYLAELQETLTCDAN